MAICDDGKTVSYDGSSKKAWAESCEVIFEVFTLPEGDYWVKKEDGNVAEESCVAKADGSSAIKAGKSCRQLKDEFPDSKSNLYWIQPTFDVAAFPVYCNMEMEGGGWTLIEVIGSRNIKKSDTAVYPIN